MLQQSRELSEFQHKEETLLIQVHVCKDLPLVFFSHNFFIDLFAFGHYFIFLSLEMTSDF